MFGGAFNRLPFNRPYSTDMYFNVDFEFQMETQSMLNLEQAIKVEFEWMLEANLPMIREISFAAEYDFFTEVEYLMIRERMMAAAFELLLEFQAGVRYTHTDQITFTGGFAPGDKIVIDSAKMTVTINGQNALHLTDGDFFALVNGLNKLTYTDGESARSVLTRVTHRDKYLY